MFSCRSCSGGHHRSPIEEVQTETNCEEANTTVENVSQTAPRRHFWIPVMGIRVFSVNYLRTFFIPSFKSSRAARSPYSPGSITIITDRRRNQNV